MEQDVELEVTASITDVFLCLKYLITVSSASAETKDVISMVDVCVTKRMIVHQEGEQLHHQVGERLNKHKNIVQTYSYTYSYSIMQSFLNNPAIYHLTTFIGHTYVQAS